MENLQKHKKDLERLIDRGMQLYVAIWHESFLDEYPESVLKYMERMGWNREDRQAEIPSFKEEYQSWYSEALAVVRALLRERLENFGAFYQGGGENYMLIDYLTGYMPRHDLDWRRIVSLFQQQLAIAQAADHRLASSLFDIKQLVRADLFDSELEAAKELMNKGFYQSAGVVAGVVMEKHLAQVCENHALELQKQRPTINDFNRILVENNVANASESELIRHLGTIRNSCAHYNEGKEVTKERVAALIEGVEKLVKTMS